MCADDARQNSHLHAFLTSTGDLEACQRALLQKRVIAPNVDTEYGRAHDFTAIADAESYRDRVPLIDYEDIRESIDRMAIGNNAILTTERAVAFFKTSGSLSSPKLVPVTSTLMRDKVAVFATFWGKIYEQYPGIQEGAMVANFSDASVPEKTETGVEITSESGFWARRGRSLHSLKRWPLPAEVRQIVDPDVRLYVTARVLLQSDLRCIMCLNPSTLLQFCRTLERHGAELSIGLTSGEWGSNLVGNVPRPDADTIASLEHHLRQDAAFSSRLTTSLKNHGKPRLGDIWPQLDLIICWCSSIVQPYFIHLKPYVEGVAVRDYITQASECMMAIPIEDGTSGGVLAYQSHFFEFIPESETALPSPKTVFSWELEAGQHYEVVVSTSGGLYRYRMGDCVKVTGFKQTTPVIEFLYRLGKTASMSGEKLTEYQVMDAARRATKATGIEPQEFLCFPMSQPTPHYGLLFDSDPLSVSNDSLKQWAQVFDEYLGTSNSEYRDKCDSGRLGKLQACRVPPGSLARARQSRRASGVSEEQVKSEVLSAELDTHEALSDVQLLS